MRLGQVHHHSRVVAAISQEASAPPIGSWTLVEVIERAEAESLSLEEFAEREAGPAQSFDSAIVVSPLEVWTSGKTSVRSQRLYHVGSGGPRRGNH